MADSGGLKSVRIFGVLFVLVTFTSAQKDRTASQCFKAPGIPKVNFACENNDMIKIKEAFHGIAKDDRSRSECKVVAEGENKNLNCSRCEGDCIDNSMNLVYDWSSCMGNNTCTRTVMQSYMPGCEEDKSKDRFSDYLQVEYQCIRREDTINVCSNIERSSSVGGYIMSPGYPNNYPKNTNCLCNLTAQPGSKLKLSFYDLLLETKNGRCRADWLMLRQKQQKHRHCGAIMTGTKVQTSLSNKLEVQFHSDGFDNHTQNFQYFTRRLKGFWLHFTAEPSTFVQVKCQPLSQHDPRVVEIKKDDESYNDAVSDVDEDTNEITDKEYDKNFKEKTKNKKEQETTRGDYNAEDSDIPPSSHAVSALTNRHLHHLIALSTALTLRIISILYD